MEKSDRRVRELGPALNSIIDRVFGEGLGDVIGE
jgi:hypothetical protein